MHARLRRGWSPEEIAGSLRNDCPDLSLMHTSHESIYRYVYDVARGELQRELAACLRRHHRTCKPGRRGVTATQGRLQDMVLVDQRPPEVENRLIASHYEGDLILGAGNKSAVGVLVERTSRYTFLCHLPEKDATGRRAVGPAAQRPAPRVPQCRGTLRLIVDFETVLTLRQGTYNIAALTSAKYLVNRTAQFVDWVEPMVVFEMLPREPQVIWGAVYLPNKVRLWHADS